MAETMAEADATTDTQWDNLAALVRQEIASGSYKHVRPT
jgi:hypothetical protein